MPLFFDLGRDFEILCRKEKAEFAKLATTDSGWLVLCPQIEEKRYVSILGNISICFML